MLDTAFPFVSFEAENSIMMLRLPLFSNLLQEAVCTLQHLFYAFK